MSCLNHQTVPLSVPNHLYRKAKYSLLLRWMKGVRAYVSIVMSNIHLDMYKKKRQLFSMEVDEGEDTTELEEIQ